MDVATGPIPGAQRVRQFGDFELARALPSGLAHLASRGTWRTAPHLNILTKKLVDLEQRRIRRLLVEMPPRHGKSELCSRYFPAWYLGRHPNHRVILASYEGGLATTHGEVAQQVFEEWAPAVFGVRAHPKRRAPYDWRVWGHIGRMRCTGSTGGITGRGANLLIIDDPIRDALEASSEKVRGNVWDWYTTTARSRLEPGGVIIVIQTRWHQDDLIGRLRKQAELEGSEQWESITLPAIWEQDTPDLLGRQKGEALWPWRFPVPELRRIKASVPEHWWNALYQQRPTPPGGSLAKRDWFPQIDVLPDPKEVRACRYWDCGGTGDPTVGALVLRYGSLFIIDDIIRTLHSPGEADQLILRTAKLDLERFGLNYCIREEQEPGSSGKAIVYTRAQMLAGFNYRGRPKQTAKEVEWMPMLIQAELGNFRIRRAAWNERWYAEVEAAPYGEHDDQLDGVSGAFKELTLKAPVKEVELLMG